MHLPPSSPGPNQQAQQGVSSSSSAYLPLSGGGVTATAADMAAQEYYNMSGGPAQQQRPHQFSSPPSYASRPPSYTSYDPNPQSRPPPPPNHQSHSRPLQQHSALLNPQGRPLTVPPPGAPLPPQLHNQRPSVQQTYSGPVGVQQQQTPYASRPVPIQYQQPYYPSSHGPAPAAAASSRSFLSPPLDKWQYPQKSHPMAQPYYPAPAAFGLSGSAPGGYYSQHRPISNPYPINASHPQHLHPYQPHKNGNVSDHSRESSSDSDGKHHKHRSSHHRRKHRHSDACATRDKSPRPHKNRDRFFGASTGALLGDIFIAPGVGTAMGALLGGFGGDSYNKTRNKEKQGRKDRDRDIEHRSRSRGR